MSTAAPGGRVCAGGAALDGRVDVAVQAGGVDETTGAGADGPGNVCDSACSFEERGALDAAPRDGAPVPDGSAIARAWDVLAGVLDPEVPVVSVCELGIVREVRAAAAGLEVVLTPTYSGCPATDVIAQSVREALDAAGLGPVVVQQRRAPPWTTDWITVEGRRKLLAYGIVPPAHLRVAGEGAQEASNVALRFVPRRPVLRLDCPRCGSADTERLAAFGSTACKALHRCGACGEPFEHFKPI